MRASRYGPVSSLMTGISLPMIVHAGILALSLTLSEHAAGSEPVPVTLPEFARAETDRYFASTVAKRGFGQLGHDREMTSIDKQYVVRMNRDTIYSSGIFDLDAGPIAITLPNVGSRFMSMQIISEDHYTVAIAYGPGRFTYSKESVGTRYVHPLIRTLANPEDPADMAAAHKAQDAILVEQGGVGSFELPQWDPGSLAKIRDALSVLNTYGGAWPGQMFGTRDEVDPLLFLIGTAIGWGGNPPSAAVYQSQHPKANDGKTVHRLTVKDVPVDGFWSVSVYNAEGFFEKNDLNAYSLNNLTAKPNADGTITIQFGGCDAKTPNCLPVTAGWNFTARLYRPREEILKGKWTFPTAEPVNE